MPCTSRQMRMHRPQSTHLDGSRAMKGWLSSMGCVCDLAEEALGHGVVLLGVLLQAALLHVLAAALQAARGLGPRLLRAQASARSPRSVFARAAASVTGIGPRAARAASSAKSAAVGLAEVVLLAEELLRPRGSPARRSRPATARAACLPPAMARMAMSVPVSRSPAANTPGTPVRPVSRSPSGFRFSSTRPARLGQRASCPRTGPTAEITVSTSTVVLGALDGHRAPAARGVRLAQLPS